ncbi:sperm-associated antigen 1 [Chelonus insularis]|uniref:sperm-associated antigen 1 n=1 Tax=Chelonus insularis TaxID=460826 RepID=UPI00158D7B12|nr:sperm-associated antigen 1-like [Chelonus insularis]
MTTSGEEGYYPNLIEYAEKKLEKIHPQNKILWIPRSIIKTDKLKHNEKLELKNDITDWIQKMYSIEKSLGHENAIDTIWSIIYPDVRSTKQVEILQKIKKKSKINRIKFCDYNSWDKYDVHVEIKKMDLKVDQKCVEMKRNLEQRKNIIITPIHIDFNLNASLSGIELNQIAEQEKWKGNEAFKVGDYQEALHFYNFCLQMNASNINGYNNRAITFIKLEKYEEALEDCNIVLKIEPTNIKGLLRRALALEKLGNKDQAIVDYIHLLKFQPTNNNAMEALKRLSIKKKQ